MSINNETMGSPCHQFLERNCSDDLVQDNSLVIEQFVMDKDDLFKSQTFKDRAGKFSSSFYNSYMKNRLELLSTSIKGYQEEGGLKRPDSFADMLSDTDAL